MTTLRPMRLEPEWIQFITGGLSINAASASPEGRPSQCRACGCRVGADGSLVLYFSRQPATDLLRDASQGGAIAVVFSDPPTHRTLQVKGQEVTLGPLAPADLATVTAYRTTFVARLGPLGFPEALVRTLLDCPDDELVAVRFLPVAAFNQTPGAQAGTPLMAGQR